MPDIPAYDDWIRHTATLLTARSRELRAVDAALHQYWNTPAGARRQPMRRALSNALANWIGTKGPQWRESTRNKPPRRIVTQLYDALNTSVFNEKDLEAFEFQDQERRKRMRVIFQGKEIVWKALNAAEDVKAAQQELKASVAGNGLWQPGPKSAKQIADLKSAHTSAAKDRVDYAPGKWQLARDVAGPGLTAGLGSAAIQAGNLNWAAQKSFGLGGVSASPVAFHQMLQDLSGGCSTADIGRLLLTAGVDVQQLAADVTPIVSNIFSGAKVLVAWGKVCLAEYRRRQAARQSDFILPGGDIAEAFKALQTLLSRAVATEGVQAGLQSADFATRTVLSFTDFGAVSSTACGVAFTLAKLLHKLALLGREYAETRDARRLLANPANLGTSLFTSYPLLGCYMLLCSDTSDTVNMVRAEGMRKNAVRFGDLAWRQQVEWIKKDGLDGVLERAAALVYSSPFLVRDAVTKRAMPVHALYGVSGLDKLQQKVSKVGFAANVVSLGGRLIA
ncbi:MAG TPA: hypothetical protein VMH81_40495 [Bryobacteraceae bacterium]|nr:hypothetical protein [Bryobacteraceae bacterium]